MSNLIINPYSQITVIEENGQTLGLEIEVPVPDESKKSFYISNESNAELVEFILDLTRWGFNNFTAEELSDDERQLLLENGFLVAAKKAPQKPLFACFLDEIEPEFFLQLPDVKDLIVNPSFRFEPFDLANVSHLIHDNNFSPHFPIIWIKLPVTEIEIGYWLRNEYIEIGERLRAGEKIAFQIDAKVLANFVQAGILVNPAVLREKEKAIEQKFHDAQKLFSAQKYVAVEEILPPHYMKAMKIFFRQYVSNGFMPFKDSQVRLRFYQHNLPLAQFFHRDFTKLMSIIAGREVKPSYVYAASYVEDADLRPHIDREQCEYSISFQVDYQPEPEDDVSPWGLYVSPLENASDPSLGVFPWEDYPIDNPEGRNCRKVNLKSGDGLFYKGCELVHYRYPLPKGHKSTSLFFHYVTKEFQGKLN